jgi:hypothetical protein
MRSIIKEDSTREIAAIAELARLINYHINNPEADHESIEEISEGLGYSIAKLDCTIWDIEDTIYALKYGSYCESEEEEEYGKLKDRKEGGND